MSIISKNEPVAKSNAAEQRRTRIADYVELTKLRISVMVLITFAAAAVLASGGAVSGFVLFFSMLGMLCVAASGNAMNMYIERYSDFLMVRTQKRPLPDQRLSATKVATFGAVSFGIGFAILLAAVNWQTALLGIANWILYVLIYTPLKRKTPLNTEVGAIAGAIPILMGSLAATGSVGLIGWALFAHLVVWQFPHFMAIAWMYREDYARGGLQMLTVTDPTGRKAGRKAIWLSIVVLLVSLLPILTFRSSLHGVLFAIPATLLGAWYIRASIEFARELTRPAARKLLKVSVIYLPLYMLVVILASLT